MVLTVTFAEQPFSSRTDLTSTDKINLKDLSFLQSHLASYLTKSCISASMAAVPFAAGAFGVVLPHLVGTAFIVAAIALPIILAAVNFKKLLYDVSFIYTVLTKKVWWGKIDRNVILGAIPLHQHLKTLKNEEKVTHVLSMVDHFELEAGIVCPVTKQQWLGRSIIQRHICTPDFAGVAPENIKQGVAFVEHVRQKDGIVYIHCKAGRGRSATIVVADKMKQFIEGSEFYSFDDDHVQRFLNYTIAEVKKICPDIHLEERQQAPIRAYIKKYVLKDGQSS